MPSARHKNRCEMIDSLLEELCPACEALEVFRDFKNSPRLCLNGKRGEQGLMVATVNTP